MDFVRQYWFYELLVLAFLVAGVFVAAATVIAERFGSKIGGLISGTPSTVVVAFLFIGLAQSPQAVVEATTIYPLVMGFTGLYLVVFAIMAKRQGFFSSLTISLLLWLIASLSVVYFNIDSFVVSLILYFIILCGSYYIFETVLHLPSTKRVKNRHSIWQILKRASFGGGMVAFAVFMSKVAGPVWGGIFAAFPAAFTSTLLITYHSSGLYVSRAMTKTLFFSGMITIVLYAVLIRYWYPMFGIALGTIAAYLVSLAAAYLVYVFMQKKLA